MGLGVGVEVLVLALIVAEVGLPVLAEEDLLVLEEPLGLLTDDLAQL
jgi:hypothetical protein